MTARARLLAVCSLLAGLNVSALSADEPKPAIRKRLTIGTIMIGVALLALLFAGGRWAAKWAVERFGQPVPLPHYEPYVPASPCLG